MSSSPTLLATARADLPASIVVALVALPLCLGVALASGAPLFAGIIAGVVGGIVVGGLSKSPLSVSVTPAPTRCSGCSLQDIVEL